MDIPSATNTALTWAFFMGTSANIRYQVLHTLLMGDHCAVLSRCMCPSPAGQYSSFGSQL